MMIKNDTKVLDFQRYCWQTSEDHGWHSLGKKFGDDIALIHSEISEALEHVRKPRFELNSVYYENISPGAGSDGGAKYVLGIEHEDLLSGNWKPDGVPVELADVIIRICDRLEQDNQRDKERRQPALPVWALGAACQNATFGDVYESWGAHFPVSMVAPSLVNSGRMLTEKDSPGEWLAFMHAKASAVLIRDELPERVVGGGTIPAHFSGLFQMCVAFSKCFEFDLWQALESKAIFNKTRPFRHGGKRL